MSFIDHINVIMRSEEFEEVSPTFHQSVYNGEWDDRFYISSDNTTNLYAIMKFWTLRDQDTASGRQAVTGYVLSSIYNICRIFMKEQENVFPQIINETKIYTKTWAQWQVSTGSKTVASIFYPQKVNVDVYKVSNQDLKLFW